ncbi:MAG: hypothetical protein NWS71_03635 [Opitutales bacterium]|jgi:hypothetical protein|nr:hypothetical protein [Opitutales bacterium]MDP4693236.1 hypothetical protein [Opitutales bacterium]MDP4778119.1 hypothetical protein [Opitutales bacterium]MDP4880169.1 hypothetical protein [Opitutales bacterium]MDP4883206.1 hypothetical protein [Opitutales bacterium]
MIRSTHTYFLASVLFLFGFITQNTFAESNVSTVQIEVILVKASNGSDGIDPALRSYSNTLERLFRFKSYQQISRDSFKVDVPGKATAKLGQGNRLTIDAQSTRNGIAADLDWSAGIHARLNLKKGTPAVLGGPKIKDGDGTYLLIIRLK